jgi:outer membrane protein assembly factor BamB
MKRIAPLVVLAASCAGKYRAPPPVPSIAMPAGEQLKPYDPANPGLARPEGMALVNGNAYVALGNYDARYYVRGPGMLAAVVPSTGKITLIDLGGSDGRQCQNPGFVRAAEGRLYVTCGGDFNANPQTGTAVVEVDPASNTVTRRTATPVSPYGVAVAGGRIWFGDSASGNVYALDRATFTTAAGPLSVKCPAEGSFKTISDVAVIAGDLYAICSNSRGGVLTRLDASTGAIKGVAQVGPIATEMAETGDGRIAIVSSGDNKLRLVTLPTLAVEVGYKFSDLTATLQDVRARNQFLFTVASSSNTVQKIDLSAKGGPKLVAEANVGEGANPWNILPLDDDQAIVSNQMANTITAVSWNQVP